MKRTLWTLALATTLLGQPLHATTYNPKALTDVIRLAITVESQGRQPIAIFDLDDTLIDTRERNLRIINDFIAQPDIQNRYAAEVANLANLQVGDVRYLMADTLAQKSVTDAAFLKEIGDFWLARFFTNEYCANDKPNPGAAAYLRRLNMAGIKIVYLTGRDVPRMHDGTVENLTKLGFPLDGEDANAQATLIMKPDPAIDDLKFKESQYSAVAAMGTVVGVFENEPANINSQANAFPEAVAVFIDTIHSPKPDVPGPTINWIKDFKKH